MTNRDRAVSFGGVAKMAVLHHRRKPPLWQLVAQDMEDEAYRTAVLAFHYGRLACEWQQLRLF